MFRQINIIISVIMLGTAFFCGCSTAPTPVAADRQKERKFKRLENVNMELRPFGQRLFTAGEKAEISIALRNNGLKLVKIPEWRTNEPDNIRLYCQVWYPNAQEPDENAWLPLDDPVKQPEKRYILELLPENQAIVKRELSFVQNLKITPGSQRRYFIKAETNLTSLKLKTKVFAIVVNGQ